MFNGIQNTIKFDKNINPCQSTNPIKTRTSLTSLSSLLTIPNFELGDSHYAVRLAQTDDEIDRALRLRFEVFNLELNEGLDVSYITGRDEDEFDAGCHHLLSFDRRTGDVIGTYRLRISETARHALDFYCAEEFDFSGLPLEILAGAVEIGRACIASEHRNSRVLFLLWKGLINYAFHFDKRYFFGCCSLTSQVESDGFRAMLMFEKENGFHPTIRLAAAEDYICRLENLIETNDLSEFKLPKLFQTYLRFGAKVCSQPAFDRSFKTIDFFILCDLEQLGEKHRKIFF